MISHFLYSFFTKQKIFLFLVLLSFTFQLNSQSSYYTFYAMDFLKRTRTNENTITQDITSSAKSNLRMSAQFYTCAGSDWFFKGDVSYLATISTAILYKKDMVFNNGLFDFQVNKSFNPNRPISMGPIDWRIGMGIAFGLKLFDNNGGEANAFADYGLSIHNSFDIGDNFQLTYFNNFGSGYNPRYEKMAWTSHEFYIMYDAGWAIQPTITPSISTYRYAESKENIQHLDIKHRYISFKIGLIRVID